MRILKFKIIAILFISVLYSSHTLAYKVLPGKSVHESITAMANVCLKNQKGIKPTSCDEYQSLKDRELTVTDYVRGVDPLYRSVSWPDDPTREFTDFNGALKSGAKVFIKDEIGCPRSNGYKYRLDKDGLFCSGHYGNLQFFHAQASSTNETADITHKKIIDWATFLYGVAVDEIDINLDYCSFWKDRNSALSSSMAPDNFAYCEERFSFKKLFSLSALNPFYPPWTVGTLLNFTCSNPFSSSTCDERIGENGKIWAQQNATGALLHLIQDSYSQSHTERGVCELDETTHLPVSKIECLPIKRYYTYNIQDSDLHSEADHWPIFSQSCQTNEKIIDPVHATSIFLWHIENKNKNIAEIKEDLYKIFGRPENTGKAPAIAGQCFNM